ncbi:B- and T-lymphocyte attenuator-like isoform X3 [Brienomyrus brachyistius]|uniref:B- and T-lymphocyte attenuator-like isoform X3 n=1 Tax=Brienomyrus brachyistius TaxID=42636 RepID=UPI0020B37A6A|nr:B- and T-lymphocyte attenuator-like isoform X3 [Brienomyrus brachyistius]
MENPWPDITHLVLFFLLLCVHRGISGHIPQMVTEENHTNHQGSQLPSVPPATVMQTVLQPQAPGFDDVCPVEIRVARNTIASAVENSSVALHCPVKHCEPRPAVTWCKLWSPAHCVTVNATDNIKMQWKYSETEPNTGTSDLIFTRVSMGDAGQYRCGVYGTVTIVSHHINVSVTDQPQDGNESSANTTGEPKTKNPFPDHPHLYIYAGIATLVVIVLLISFFSKRGCQGSNHSTKAEDAGIQYSVILRTHQASPRPSISDQSHNLYANPVRISGNDVHDKHPNRKTSRKKQEASSEAPPTRGSVPGQVAVEMDSSSAHDDMDPNTIVYATLNYRAMGRDQSRVCVQPPVEEHSEYASIRVQ